ncbi:alpha/beta hydrolase [Streptomyces nogalater]
MDRLSTFTYAYDGERLSGAGAGPAGRATALLLHGAGNGSKERLLPFLADFADRGCRALAFDFSGHGESTGALAESSLRRRYEQAVAVLDAHAPADDPLIVIGFSMSGQTVADLVRHYGPRVAAVGLCAPAVYAEEAWDLPFGTGDGRFSRLIRTPDTWRDSPPWRRSARTGPGGAGGAGHRHDRPGGGHTGRTGGAVGARPVHPPRPPGRRSHPGAVVPRPRRGPSEVRDGAAGGPGRARGHALR